MRSCVQSEAVKNNSKGLQETGLPANVGYAYGTYIDCNVCMYLAKMQLSFSQAV